jgi:hypothetical protein
MNMLGVAAAQMMLVVYTKILSTNDSLSQSIVIGVARGESQVYRLSQS